MALKYNFVTDITSLVITRPEADKVLDKNVEIVSLDKDGSSYADLSPNFSAGSDDKPEAPDYEYANQGDLDDALTPKREQKPKPTPSSDECQLILFSKTYLRGESKTVTADAATLGDFDDKTTSLEVRGHCCWDLFPGPNFSGEKKEFEAGQYKSSADMEDLFRNVSSVRKIDNC